MNQGENAIQEYDPFDILDQISDEDLKAELQLRNYTVNEPTKKKSKEQKAEDNVHKLLNLLSASVIFPSGDGAATHKSLIVNDIYREQLQDLIMAETMKMIGRK